MKSLLTATATLALLAGCADIASGPQTFNQPAGAQLDTGNFGNVTMQNTLVQTGQADTTVGLARRFAAEVDSTITFDFNASQLTPAAQATLSQQATWIKQFPEIRFKVFGHTDLVGSAAYNKRLGLARANAAVNYLVAQGVSRSRLEAVASFGETKPVIPTPNREQQNRRTVTEVSGVVKGHPTLMNGKYAEVIFREYLETATPTSSSSETQGGGQ